MQKFSPSVAQCNDDRLPYLELFWGIQTLGPFLLQAIFYCYKFNIVADSYVDCIMLHWRMFHIIIQHSSHLILHNFPELLCLCALPKHEDVNPKNVAKTDYALITPWSRRISYFVFKHVFDKSDVVLMIQSHYWHQICGKKCFIHCSRHCLLKTHRS